MREKRPDATPAVAEEMLLPMTCWVTLISSTWFMKMRGEAQGTEAVYNDAYLRRSKKEMHELVEREVIFSLGT